MANRKQSDHPTNEEILARRALMMRDLEMKKLEVALEPYGFGDDYNLKAYIEQGKWLLRQEAGIHLGLGCILLEIKHRENSQTFAKIISEDFGGMSQRCADNYMTFAKKCIELKKLQAFGEKNWSKLLALMHGMTDEQLKEIEEKGIDGKALDEFDDMSVRDFKRVIKKLTEKFDDTLAIKTLKLKSERDDLKNERDELKVQLIDPTLPEGVDAFFKTIEHKLTECVLLANRINFKSAFPDPLIKGKGGFPIIALYNQRILTMKTQYNNLLDLLEDAMYGKK
jgi:hypothetical protein